MVADIIEFQNVSKYYGDIAAAQEISLRVNDGEFLALLGPSGAGKTTLLRMLAGFEQPSSGQILLDGRNIVNTPPHKRETGMVFQDYALFPHMTVEENIAFGLKRLGFSQEEIDTRVQEVLQRVDMAGLEDRKPRKLSGGQQQRVATARALAIEPKVLLMDEPLGALDKRLRDRLQVEVAQLQQELNITTVYVTHNQTEALVLADRIVVMNHGQIEQIAPPQELYNEPETRFVVDFIGDANFINGDLTMDNSDVVVRKGDHTITVHAETIPQGKNSVFVRPEKISLRGPEYDGEKNQLPGVVDTVLFQGSSTQYYVTVGDDEFLIKNMNKATEEAQTDSQTFETGDDVMLVWSPLDTKMVNE